MSESFPGKAPAQPQPEIRDALFGDRPFEYLADHSASGEPWASFKDAKDALDRGDRKVCIRVLKEIVNRKNLESRHYVQAWHFLKQLGVSPSPEVAKNLYGVVVEVGMERGLDIIAAYSDLHARYFNFSGAAIIWERPDAGLDALIQELLHSGQAVVNRIGPWTEPRPAAPPKGQVRINMLTPSGLHFGQAPFSTVASDLLAGPVVTAAVALMKELIRKVKK